MPPASINAWVNRVPGAVTNVIARIARVMNMPAEPTNRSNLRPTRSIRAMATKVNDVDVDSTQHDRGGREGLAFIESDGAPDEVGVVEHRIDADELLEDREDDADPDQGEAGRSVDP